MLYVISVHEGRLCRFAFFDIFLLPVRNVIFFLRTNAYRCIGYFCDLVICLQHQSSIRQRPMKISSSLFCIFVSTPSITSTVRAPYLCPATSDTYSRDLVFSSGGEMCPRRNATRQNQRSLASVAAPHHSDPLLLSAKILILDFVFPPLIIDLILITVSGPFFMPSTSLRLGTHVLSAS